jgi:hypothetical protein
MKRDSIFRTTFSKEELAIFERLTSPPKIQEYLNNLPYSPEERYRCPKTVLRDRMAHCFDGALFAAAALRYLGYPPLIVEMLPNDRDDDHLLAVYKVDGRWGAVAKSNFAGLTYREPVYRNIRELILSYFEQFYNIEREKTLRGYTVPLNLRPFDGVNWMGEDGRLDDIGEGLDKVRKVRVVTPSMIRRLALVDERSYKAGLMGANPDGIFKPE